MDNNGDNVGDGRRGPPDNDGDEASTGQLAHGRQRQRCGGRTMRPLQDKWPADNNDNVGNGRQDPPNDDNAGDRQRGRTNGPRMMTMMTRPPLDLVYMHNVLGTFNIT